MILPDYLQPGLRLVVCGTAPGRASAAAGHYYAGPGNRFWEYLFLAGFAPVQLKPQDDSTVLAYGIGLTDVAKDVAGTDEQVPRDSHDAPGFVAKIEKFAPAWVAFHGKASARTVLAHLGLRGTPAYGMQSFTIGATRLFVLPSASAANQRRDYETRSRRVDWFVELAQLVGFSGSN